MKELIRLVRTLMWLAFAAAIYQELRKPQEARTWNGKVAGPFLRLPVCRRWTVCASRTGTRTAIQLFSERVFGVGWAVNIPVATRRISEIAAQYAESSASLRRRVSGRDEPQALRDDPSRPDEP